MISIIVVAVSEVRHSNDLQVFCSFLCSHHQAYLQEIIWVLSAVPWPAQVNLLIRIHVIIIFF